MSVTIGGMQQLIDALTRRSSGPSLVQTSASTWYVFQQHVARLHGREPMTRADSDQWLVDSPRATDMGDGLWQITSEVLPGDCSRLVPA